MDASLLDKPIDLSPPVNSSNEEEAIKLIIERLSNAKNPAIFVDFLVHAHGKKEAQKLVEVLKVPIYASHMAKCIVDEDHPRFVGLHNGVVSFPGISNAVQACDLVLALSWWPADTNSGGFSRNISPEKRIDIMDSYVVVSRFPFLMPVLNCRLNQSRLVEVKNSKTSIWRPCFPNSPMRSASNRLYRKFKCRLSHLDQALQNLKSRKSRKSIFGFDLLNSASPGMLSFLTQELLG